MCMDDNNVGDRCHVIVPNESEHATGGCICIKSCILIKLGDDLVDICNPGDGVVIVGHLYAQ